MTGGAASSILLMPLDNGRCMDAIGPLFFKTSDVLLTMMRHDFVIIGEFFVAECECACLSSNLAIQ
jgi:hypothetical protein